MAIQVFGDESGQVGGRHFLVGLLPIRSSDRERLENDLQRLKLERKFTSRELHYRELNGPKGVLARAFIDWFLAVPEAIFRCTVVPAPSFDATRFRGNLKFISADEMAYNVIYAQSIIKHLTSAEMAERKILTLDHKDKARPDEFERFLRQKIANVIDFQEVASENHNLLQLVDLLVGCVAGDLNGVQKHDKRAVIDHLKMRLSIRSFRDRNEMTKRKFRVAFWTGGASREKREGPI